MEIQDHHSSVLKFWLTKNLFFLFLKGIILHKGDSGLLFITTAHQIKQIFHHSSWALVKGIIQLKVRH